MGKITVTAEMRARLVNLNEKQELLDEQGHLIGYFEPPAPMPKRKFEAWGPFTAEEVEQAFTQKGRGRTLEEIYREFGL